MTFYLLYDAAHSPEKNIVSLGKIRNLCVKSILFLQQFVTTFISFGIKFFDLQISNCEYCCTLYSRTAILSPLQTMIKFPNQLELGLQHGNRKNIQIFIQMLLVLTIWSHNYSKKKGVCMQVCLQMLILIQETEFKNLNKNLEEKQGLKTEEKLCPAVCDNQTDLSSLRISRIKYYLYFYLLDDKKEQAILCAQVLMKPSFQCTCLPVACWPSGCLVLREQTDLIKRLMQLSLSCGL